MRREAQPCRGPLSRVGGAAWVVRRGWRCGYKLGRKSGEGYYVWGDGPASTKPSVALRSGLLLSQGGEFAFVIFALAQQQEQRVTEQVARVRRRRRHLFLRAAVALRWADGTG